MPVMTGAQFYARKAGFLEVSEGSISKPNKNNEGDSFVSSRLRNSVVALSLLGGHWDRSTSAETDEFRLAGFRV